MFLTLAFLLSLLKRNDIEPIVKLQSGLRLLNEDNPTKIDVSLELAIGLHKFFTLQIMRLVSVNQLTKEQSDLSISALNNLFDGNCGWWYKNQFLIKYPGSNADWTLRAFFESLLFQADYYDQSSEGIIINLPEREQRAFIMLQGLSDQKSFSLEKTAEELNMSRERIRQTKEKVARLIRNNAAKKEIKMNFLND